MPGEKMHPSLLRANQHLEKIRTEMRSVSSEMNDFYDKYMTLDDENDILRNCLQQLLNRIEGDSERTCRPDKTESSDYLITTKNVDAVRRLLGQSSVTATSAYLGVTDESALDLARIYSIRIR